jgi:hypothetical protein
MTLSCVAGCGTPTADFLCAGCLSRLGHTLRELAGAGRVLGLLDELDVTRSRQDVLNADGFNAHGSHPDPMRPDIAHLVDVAANTITTWARLLHEDHPHLRAPAGTTRDAAVWVAQLPAVILARHVGAGEFYRDVAALAARIRAAIDRRPDLVYSGPCGALDGPDTCPGHLYARPGQDAVRCPLCGTRYAVADRREWMLRRALDVNVPGAVALGWTRLLMGQTVPAGTWRSWLSRRRIVSRGTDRHGRPVYRFGDVHDLVRGYQGRRRAA